MTKRRKLFYKKNINKKKSNPEYKRRPRISPVARKNMWRKILVRGFYGFIIFGAALPILIGLYSFAKFLNNSKTYNVKDVVIKGQERLTRTYIERMIDIVAIKKQKVFKVNIKDIEKQIYRIPLIKEAVVRRELPNRILITLVERKPFARLSYNQKIYEVDIDGVVTRELLPRELDKLPLIQGISVMREGFELGRPTKSNKLLRAIEVLKLVLVSEISRYYSIESINVDNIKQIVIYTKNKVEIQLGSDDIKKKLNNLVVLLKEGNSDVKNAQFIDLRFGGVIIRPKGGR